MKKIVLPFILLSIFLYSLSNWVGVIREQTATYNLLVLSNFICLLCLIIASIYGMSARSIGEKKVDFEEEDERQLSIERKAYDTVLWTQAALTISFVSIIAGFMLVRDLHPEIVSYAILLSILSFVGLGMVYYLNRYTNPEYKLPDPKSPTYQQELFDSYDDGEKHLMLKGLYKLYYWIITLLVFLSFGLMFYSIFTKQSQLISIIGIGCILLFVQTYYALSLKPKKSAF